MPSETEFLQQAEDWKKQGNEFFQKSNSAEAIKAYSQGLVQVDRLVPPPVALKTALLSNRAACYLKLLDLDRCVEDCTSALDILSKAASDDAKIRSKLLYRRSKAHFLKANMPGKQGPADLLTEAAKDLMNLLSFDPKNKDATTLLQSIRAQHAMQQKSNTPLSKTLDSIKKLEEGDNEKDRIHKFKVLIGLLDNDSSSSMELGRLGGVAYLLDVANKEKTENAEVRALAFQSLGCAGSHPPFVRAHCKDIQQDVSALVTNEVSDDVVVGGLAVLLRCVLHLDRDDPNQSIGAKTSIDYQAILSACVAALEHGDLAIRGAMETLTVWMAGQERHMMIRTAIAGGVKNTGIIDGIPPKASKYELDAMSAKEMATYRAREHECKTRDLKWAMERSKLFCERGGLDALLKCIARTEDHVLRREITVVMGRILSSLDQEIDEVEVVKKIAKPLLSGFNEEEDRIEEVFNEDDEDPAVEEEESTSIELMIKRAALTTSLLLSKKEAGTWALSYGWTDSHSDIDGLINSKNDTAMGVASEFISAASSVEDTRAMVGTLVDAGKMEKLLMHKDKGIKSGAAAAVSKLGLAGKDKQQADEGEIMGLLQVAADLLEDEDDEAEQEKKEKAAQITTSGKTSVERGVEIVTYLISQTHIKEEISCGFRSTMDSKQTILEHLVKLSEKPNIGASLTGYGLATIFQHMAVTPQTLKEEHFEDKELSADEYDQLQTMAKTDEEKKMAEANKKVDDSKELCAERIKKMAAANVGRAFVQLLDGASEKTLEQVVVGMRRMAAEPAARGSLIQQGVITACINVEKGDNPTKQMKKNIQISRHCIAKILVTVNPSLLTNAQRIGSIKPLLQLLRDVEAKQLLQYEALMALTNIAASGDDAKKKIVTERGLAALHFAMFSEHWMIRQAATEALCNLVGNEDFEKYLADPENLRLWLALASDFDEHYACSRAACGCLAMACQNPEIAIKLVKLPFFQKHFDTLLESGEMELMHRVLVALVTMVSHGGEIKETVVKEGFKTFCVHYVTSYHDGTKAAQLDIPEEDLKLLPVTVDLAKEVIRIAEEE